jgi:hypothetical protein
LTYDEFIKTIATAYEENKGETLGDLSFPAGATIAIYSCRTDNKWFGVSVNIKQAG